MQPLRQTVSFVHKSYISNFCAGFIQKGVIVRTAICMALAMLLIIIGNTTGDCAQDDGGLRLIDAVLEGNRQVVEKSLKDGVLVDAENEQGETALIWACFKGDTASVSLLLDKGANPAKASKAGITPIIAAASFGHTEIAKTFRARLNLEVVALSGLPARQHIDEKHKSIKK